MNPGIACGDCGKSVACTARRSVSLDICRRFYWSTLVIDSRIQSVIETSFSRFLLLLAAFSSVFFASVHEAAANEVEFVVGDLMVSEGGQWDSAKSRLTSPFGVAFNSGGDMWIVELEGGRVHKLDSSGKLHHAGGDGSASYKGDGGQLADATFNGMHNCDTLPNGDLLIGDSWNHCIRKVDAKTGVITTIAGNGKKGFSGDGGPA
ncbi:MAG: hypothetical protein DWI00_16895, partial [Planctomycetota bacterium]